MASDFSYILVLLDVLVFFCLHLNYSVGAATCGCTMCLLSFYSVNMSIYQLLLMMCENGCTVTILCKR